MMSLCAWNPNRSAGLLCDVTLSESVWKWQGFRVWLRVVCVVVLAFCSLFLFLVVLAFCNLFLNALKNLHACVLQLVLGVLGHWNTLHQRVVIAVLGILLIHDHLLFWICALGLPYAGFRAVARQF